MTHRAKTTKYASDDHADDLLADILASTEEAAQREQKAVEAELSARRQAQEQAKAEAHADRIAARQVKLQTELERQEQLAKRRTMRMQALAPPVEVDEEVTETPAAAAIDEDEIRRQIAAEVREEFRVVHMTPVTTAPVRRSVPGGLIAAAAAIVLGGVAIAAALIGTSYTPDTNPYAKAIFAPMDRNAVALEVGSTPIPQLEEVEAVTAEPEKIKQRKSPLKVEKVKKPKSAFAKPTEKSKAATSYDKLKNMLDDSTDPFAMD